MVLPHVAVKLLGITKKKPKKISFDGAEQTA